MTFIKNNVKKSNDYTNLLNELDKTGTTGGAVLTTKESIDEYIRQLNMKFKKYDNPQFCGWSMEEIKEEDISNPDLFINNEINQKREQKRNYTSKTNNDENNNAVATALNIVQDVSGSFVYKGVCPVPPEDPFPPPIPVVKKKVNIEYEVKNLQDLIQLIDTYPYDEGIEYNVNIASLNKIKPSLIEMNDMIGMTGLKENIVDQILYFVQDLHRVNETNTGDFMHTVIYGSPGTGKTEIAKIMGKIFSHLGVLRNSTFKKVTRSDLIAGYLGQTAIKTRDVIAESLGGCLFIDEAYSLGNSDKKDTFSKECIDTLCEALSHYKHDLMVIIAGYEKELNDCFFAYNKGLDSRFTWRFKTEDYKGDELFRIFCKKVKDIGWSLEENVPPTSETAKGFGKYAQKSEDSIHSAWFEKNVSYFAFFGRDMETLLSKVKIAHSRRVFCKDISEKTKITFKDLEKGFEMYLKNDEVKNRKENKEASTKLIYSMYV